MYINNIIMGRECPKTTKFIGERLYIGGPQASVAENCDLTLQHMIYKNDVEKHRLLISGKEVQNIGERISMGL